MVIDPTARRLTSGPRSRTFHEHRRDLQDAGDVIEAEARLVGGTRDDIESRWRRSRRRYHARCGSIDGTSRSPGFGERRRRDPTRFRATWPSIAVGPWAPTGGTPCPVLRTAFNFSAFARFAIVRLQRARRSSDRVAGDTVTVEQGQARDWRQFCGGFARRKDRRVIGPNGASAWFISGAAARRPRR